MSEKLSDRLKANSLAYELLGEHDLPALLREAARIVRAVETAPECVVETVSGFDESERPVLDVYVKNGKRVRLVEVE